MSQRGADWFRFSLALVSFSIKKSEAQLSCYCCFCRVQTGTGSLAVITSFMEGVLLSAMTEESVFTQLLPSLLSRCSQLIYRREVRKRSSETRARSGAAVAALRSRSASDVTRHHASRPLEVACGLCACNHYVCQNGGEPPRWFSLPLQRAYPRLPPPRQPSSQLTGGGVAS